MELEFYIGTHLDNDTKIEKRLKNAKKIKSEMSDKSISGSGLIHFFAKDLNNAKRMAKEMDLENFSKVSDTLYKKGRDY